MGGLGAGCVCPEAVKELSRDVEPLPGCRV